MSISFLGLLQIVFITLKLTGYIAWPWFWVLTPIWGTVLLGVFVFLIAALMEFISAS